MICLSVYDNNDRNKIFLHYNIDDYLNYYCIVLSELTENMHLKIINKSYFTNINEIKNLTEKDNKFYKEFYQDGCCISIF